MQKILVFIALLTLSIHAFAQHKHQEANQLLEQLITGQKVIGAVGAYSVQGEVQWQAVRGHADLENKKEMQVHTLIRTASIAKPMTAVAVMQLLEQGMLQLDAPVRQYIPDFPSHGQNEITVEHLLTHTSGIDGYKNSKESENKQNYPQLSAAVDVFKDRKLRFEPGTDFFYTTYGYVVLGLLIEKVSGLTYEAYMQQNIWDKAGMTRTGIEKYGIVKQGQSSLYHRSKSGKIKRGEENNLSNRIPGGGLYTTMEDLLNFANALLDHRLIKESTMSRMIQVPTLRKEGNFYAFGWFLYGPKPNENVVIGHGGEQTGTSAQLMIVPKSKTVVVVLTNTSGALKEVLSTTAKLIALSEKRE